MLVASIAETDFPLICDIDPLASRPLVSISSSIIVLPTERLLEDAYTLKESTLPVDISLVFALVTRPLSGVLGLLILIAPSFFVILFSQALLRPLN